MQGVRPRRVSPEPSAFSVATFLGLLLLSLGVAGVALVLSIFAWTRTNEHQTCQFTCPPGPAGAPGSTGPEGPLGAEGPQGEPNNLCNGSRVTIVNGDNGRQMTVPEVTCGALWRPLQSDAFLYTILLPAYSDAAAQLPLLQRSSWVIHVDSCQVAGGGITFALPDNGWAISTSLFNDNQQVGPANPSSVSIPCFYTAIVHFFWDPSMPRIRVDVLYAEEDHCEIPCIVK